MVSIKNNSDGAWIEQDGELLVLQRYIKPDSVVFDVGANVGGWSNLVLQHESNCTIHAFEPVPQMFEELESRFSDKNLVLNQIALSDTAQEFPFYYYENRDTLSTLHRRVAAEKEYNIEEPVEIQVHATTVDSYCEENDIRQINFMKVDVEGAELSLLKGAKHMLKRGYIDFIQFEYGGTYLDAGTTLSEVFELLHKNRYHIYKIFPQGIAPVPEFRSEFEDYQYSNFLAIQERLIPSADGVPKMLDIVELYPKFNIYPRGILHIGAHEGEERTQYDELQVLDVLYVEANPEVYKRLKSNIADYPRIHGVNCAVSDENGEIELNVTSMDQSSSILPLKKHSELYPGIVKTHSVTVPCYTVDTLLEELKIPSETFNVIHIDIQGAELKALKGATQLLQNIDAVMTEINFKELYEGCALIHELDDFMDEHGFERVATITPYDPSWGDGLYIRKQQMSILSIGYGGRFANQLVRYMYCESIAAQHGISMTYGNWIGDELFNTPDSDNQITTFSQVYEPDNREERIPFRDDIPNHTNIDLNGYFQHGEFFAAHKELLRERLTPQKELKERLDTAYAKLQEGDRTVIAIHLRRGDYGYECFFVSPSEWYRTWLKDIWSTVENPVLYIATDDPSVREDFAEYSPVLASDLGCTIEHAPYFLDFYILSKADKVAISNSSFSYIATMLNENADTFMRPRLSLQKLISYTPWESKIIYYDENVEEYPHLKQQITSNLSSRVHSITLEIDEDQRKRVNDEKTIVYLSTPSYHKDETIHMFQEPLFFSTNEVVVINDTELVHSSIPAYTSVQDIPERESYTSLVVVVYGSLKNLPDPAEINRFSGSKRLVVKKMTPTRDNILALCSYINSAAFSSIIEEESSIISEMSSLLLKKRIVPITPPQYSYRDRHNKSYSFAVGFLFRQSDFNRNLLNYLGKYGIFATPIDLDFWEMNNQITDTFILVDGTNSNVMNRGLLSGVANGRTVVMSSSKLIRPSFIESGKTHYEFQENENCLRKIVTLLHNPDIARNMGESAHGTYDRHFSEYLDYYNHIESKPVVEKQVAPELIEPLLLLKSQIAKGNRNALTSFTLPDFEGVDGIYGLQRYIPHAPVPEQLLKKIVWGTIIAKVEDLPMIMEKCAFEYLVVPEQLTPGISETLFRAGLKLSQGYKGVYEWKSKREFIENLLNNKNYSIALELLTDIVNKDENNIWALNCLGVISSDVQDYDGAETIFSHILSVDGTQRDTVLNLAGTLMQLGKGDQARSELQKYINLCPHDREMAEIIRQL